VLFRLAYLGVTNTLTLLRLLPMSDRDKDAEILTLRHQIAVLEQQTTRRKGPLHLGLVPPGQRPLLRGVTRPGVAGQLRPAQENSTWGYRRIHGELLVLGIKVDASTVWEILHEAGIDPAPQRTGTTWATFLRSQAQAIIAADFFETTTLIGTRL
jgi:transposase